MPKSVRSSCHDGDMESGRAQVQGSRLADSVFVYGGGKLALESATRIARKADGLVVRGKSGAKLARAMGGAAPDVRIILDPSLYERPAASQLSLIASNELELERQIEIGAAAYLSPSPFIPDADRAALFDVLTEGDDFCRAARSRWLVPKGPSGPRDGGASGRG